MLIKILVIHRTSSYNLKLHLVAISEDDIYSDPGVRVRTRVRRHISRWMNTSRKYSAASKHESQEASIE